MASGWTPPDTPIGAADSGGWKPPDTPHPADSVATTQKPTFGERALSLIPGAGAIGELGRGAGEEFGGVYGKRQETLFTALGATLAQLVRGAGESVGSLVGGMEKGGEALAGKGPAQPGDILPPETTGALLSLAGTRGLGLPSPASLGVGNTVAGLAGSAGTDVALGAGRTAADLARSAPEAIRSAAQTATEAASAIPGKVAEAAKSLRTSPEDAAAQKATATAGKAAKKVSKSLSGGGAPAGQDIIEELGKAQKTGQPLTLADIESPDIKNMIGNVYRQGGAAAKRIRDFFDQRDKAATGRVEGIIKDQLADGSIYQTEKELKKVRSAQAEAPYEKAMAHAPVWSPRLQAFLNEPEMKGWMRAGYARMRKEAIADGKPFKPQDFAVVDFNEAGDPIFGPVPTMRLLAAAKTGLDARIEDILSGGKMTDEARVLIKFRNAYRKELDSLNGDYAAAREIWEGDTANLNALRNGQRLFEKGYYRIDEIPELVAEMSPSERQNFILGVADELKSRLLTKVDSRDKGSIINNEDMRRRLAPFFQSEDAAGKFLADIERESVMKRTPTEVRGGSQTQGRSVVDEMLHSAWSHAKAGHPVRALTAASAHGIEHLAERMGRARQAEVNDAIARILTDPNVARQIWANKGKTQIVVPPPQ